MVIDIRCDKVRGVKISRLKRKTKVYAHVITVRHWLVVGSIRNPPLMSDGGAREHARSIRFFAKRILFSREIQYATLDVSETCSRNKTWNRTATIRRDRGRNNHPISMTIIRVPQCRRGISRCAKWHLHLHCQKWRVSTSCQNADDVKFHVIAVKSSLANYQIRSSHFRAWHQVSR